MTPDEIPEGHPHSWYDCPRCGRKGFASIYQYPKAPNGCCTDCSNFLRGFTPDPLEEEQPR